MLLTRTCTFLVTAQQLHHWQLHFLALLSILSQSSGHFAVIQASFTMVGSHLKSRQLAPPPAKIPPINAFLAPKCPLTHLHFDYEHYYEVLNIRPFVSETRAPRKSDFITHSKLPALGLLIVFARLAAAHHRFPC